VSGSFSSSGDLRKSFILTRPGCSPRHTRVSRHLSPRAFVSSHARRPSRWRLRCVAPTRLHL
jgi:hypothetical protein